MKAYHKMKALDVKRAVANVTEFTRNVVWGEQDIIKASPIPISSDPLVQTKDFLTTMFEEHDKLSLHFTFVRSERGKPVPKGAGHTCLMKEWQEFLDKKMGKAFRGEAGGLYRINPLDGKGIKDANVVRFPYVLTEFDHLPMELQLRFYSIIKLPIAALYTSGGVSIHALIRIDAANAEEYRVGAKRLYGLLTPFGIDPMNKNPSRLSRLPGAYREVGGVGDGLQKLLYLNPNPTSEGLGFTRAGGTQ
ncbi:MAG: hypothetical protein ACYDC1_25585 [Limisphaerales bacterium]